MIQEQTFKQPHHSFYVSVTLPDTVNWLRDWCPTEGAQIIGQLQKSKFEFYWICTNSTAGRKGLYPRRQNSKQDPDTKDFVQMCCTVFFPNLQLLNLWKKVTETAKNFVI